jgi:Schlafen, AlbA_2
MDLDRLIHGTKHFAELDDNDVESFLRERKFHAEHLNIEFKNAFPQKPGGKYEVKKICKYIVGFSNEDGGLVVYGVADSIKDGSVSCEKYVIGLRNHPSIEDLSLWIKDTVHPLVASPAVRFFEVMGRKVAILKIPAGVNKPYSYCDLGGRSLAYFKKTAGGIVELSPDEVKEFYRTQIIEQAYTMLRATESHRLSLSRADGSGSKVASKRANEISSKLEDPKNYGLVEIYCAPVGDVELSVSDLEKFVRLHQLHFSESMRYFREVEVRQDGVSVGYFPSAIRKDAKSTVRISLFRDGTTSFDALADTFLRGDRELHSGWLSYELQRHLQLSKALLSGRVAQIYLTLNLRHIETFRLGIMADRLRMQYATYTGSHEPIMRRVTVADIYDYDGSNRNVAMPVVQDIMKEVGTIFGLTQAPVNLWDSNGYLTFVKGVEGQR